MTASDYTIQFANLSDFFKNLGKKGITRLKQGGNKGSKKSRKSFGNWSKRRYCICFLKP